MAMRRYPIRLGRRSAILARLWGASEATAYVDLDGVLEARFGFFRLRFGLDNVTGWRIEGPWRWITAIGVRRSVRHGDVSFCGDPAHGGIRLDLRERVPWGPFNVPALSLGVEDLAGFAAELSRQGIPGEDVRRR